MKWNGRPDPGERTRRRVHRNEGHPLPGDAGVSGDGPGQARPGSSPTDQPTHPTQANASTSDFTLRTDWGQVHVWRSHVRAASV